MAKYQKYAEYKDSGVEWLGGIPSHWKIASLRFLVEAVSNGSTASQVEESETTVPISRIESISTGEIDMNKVGFVDIKTISQNFKLHKNDILLSHINSLPMVGNIALKRDDSTLFHGMNLLRLVPNRTITAPYYLFWLLKSIYFRKSVESVAKPAINQASVSIDSLKNIKLLVPNIDEQIAIANFLDHETTKIDHLIEKQQQLIELLKEKRQAVISHAVTKGLDSNVPMKDSGVEWLGEVPEHWEIKQNKYLLEFVTSGSRGWAQYYADTGSLFFRIANLTRDTIEPKLESIQYVEPPKGSEGERSKIKINDLLISITADLGSVCVADASIKDGYVSQHVALCRPIKICVSRWLAYFILSDCAKEQFLGSGYGGTKIQLSLEDIKELIIAVPPRNEQLQISEYIDEKLTQYEHLICQAEKLIGTLQERRTALISAAVTGKIDVRNWQAPTVAEADTELSA